MEIISHLQDIIRFDVLMLFSQITDKTFSKKSLKLGLIQYLRQYWEQNLGLFRSASRWLCKLMPNLFSDFYSKHGFKGINLRIHKFSRNLISISTLTLTISISIRSSWMFCTFGWIFWWTFCFTLLKVLLCFSIMFSHHTSQMGIITIWNRLYFRK